MTRTTHRFSEAASLYAANKAVVDEMRKAFTESMKLFFTELTGSVREAAVSAGVASVSSRSAGQSWYWWPGDADATDADVKVWATWDDEEIITLRTLSVLIGTGAVEMSEVERMATLARSAKLEPWLVAQKPAKWVMVRLDAKWAEDEDAIAACVPTIVAALKLVDRFRREAPARKRQ